MSERTQLLSVSYHADDDTGMYQVGEIDFGVNAKLEDYVKRYGYKGVEDILATLGHLAWEVKDCFYRTQAKIPDMQTEAVNQIKSPDLTKLEKNEKTEENEDFPNTGGLGRHGPGCADLD